MAQQWGGDLGSGAFRVVGIFDTGAGGFNEGNVYVLKSDAQRVLNLGDRITEVVVMLEEIEQCDATASDLAQRLGDMPINVLTWKDRIPLVAQYIEIAHRFIWPYYAVFYLAMAFGIVNALSMAIGERTYEIGVMLAVGMRRERIVTLILLEALFTAVLAGVTGLAVGGALVGWLGHRGIDFSAFEKAMDYMGVGKVIYPHLEPQSITSAVVVMMVTALVFSLIPAVRAARMMPVAALRTAR
jgi:ABC-type lipoprotein release transport system permease subunit